MERVEALISAFTGLDRAYGEPVQGQRYAVGQEFTAHTDYFEPGGADYTVHCRVTGNRTCTVMISLNHPGPGGSPRRTDNLRVGQACVSTFSSLCPPYL